MSRSIRIKGPGSVNGGAAVPGDKSISHRAAMIASVAKGATTIGGFATSADCLATLDCVRRLGVRVDRLPDAVIIHGSGLNGYGPAGPRVNLYAANSGSTIRMLSGLLAAQNFTSVIDGDESLRRRPMARIIEPLTAMGARVSARDARFAPLVIEGGRLKPIEYASSVASAQVKTCVLFAGLYADGRTVFAEPARSRNHTELMLKEFGARIEYGPPWSNSVTVEGGQELTPADYQVPGDVSSAAFLVAAATVLPESHVVIRDVNLNPTRTAFLDVLNALGARVETPNARERHGEPIGDVDVASRPLKRHGPSMTLTGESVPNVIDEIPILAVVGTQVEGRVEIRDARELRVKESDRIRTIVNGVRALGGEIEEFEDGFAVEGPQRLTGGRVETSGDHRIAMAFSIAGLIAEGTTEIVDADCASVSFPEFYDLLDTLSGGHHVIRH
ncbi:MAG TPA: 3-phosphoshikimate 1-carboxyvinyltransferase [Blastocatellia bacterium]|nr:3-phosphoshikimate 1-carboxyvinyltransferase [Blastocatellia bacterium]